MNIPVESLPLIIFYSIFSLAVIGSGLFIAGRAGFYIPYFEGLLKNNENRNAWMKRTVAISLLVSGVGSLFILLLNVNISSDSFPSSPALVLASIDAGIQEEIFYRLFLMSAFAVLGFLIAESNERAKEIVIWSSILLSGIIFGWAHIDNHLMVPEIRSSVDRVIPAMIVNTMFGIVLGFIYWKQGLECAMLSHFLIDAIGLGVVLPVYLFAGVFIKIIVFLVIALIVVISYRILTQIGLKDIRTYMV